jgi:chromosome segregation ATPase
MIEKILARKLPLSLIVSNGGIILGLIWGAFSFYQQVNASTEAIAHLSESVASLEERIDTSNVDQLNDMYFQLTDQLQSASVDIGWQLDEIKRESDDKMDRIKEEASWLAERLSSLETQLQQLDEDGWKQDEVQRDISYMKEQLAVLQASTTQWDVETIDTDLQYLKERVVWLEAQQGQGADTQWLEDEINHLRQRLDEYDWMINDNTILSQDAAARIPHLENSYNDLWMLVDDLITRLTRLENVGNHAKLLQKAIEKGN